ncbi:hypothetical protein [cyanobacterium endosymbiont of Epithemia clementina EcSB]|uniref:hypothetical protein n=1 Tax=cyanobacterium endosymbiont of Epithemia clementina EcSB TaxID=3034674 RepID=UPI002480BC2B|nr:hypothetical protein [cyanobacterium endosymbiont of Epithemia clementina EcSB]WGT67896.1 hypothetical protein P3F56_02090 [cyanobacterium endosymbiont of Epithemia clementina EcSB]
MDTARIPQLNNLTYGLHKWFPKLISDNQLWLFFIIPIVVSLPSVSVSQSLGTLPPPPPLRVPENAVPNTSTEPGSEFSRSISVDVAPAEPISSMNVREYTFQAPTSPPSSVPVTPVTPRSSASSSQSNKTPSLYRVEVVGKNRLVLSQVQTVEPLAFIRQSEGVIHAGIFKQSQQAQKRVVELQSKGLSASVVRVYKGKERSN